MKTVLQNKNPQGENEFPRMVRPGSLETQRPQAGGEGIGCPSRMSRDILPAPLRRHTSTCASEDGIPTVRPRGRVPNGFGIRHAGAGARTPSRLWTSRPCGPSPQHRTSKADSQSALRLPLARRLGLQLDDAALNGLGDGFGAIGHEQFVENIFQMAFDSN